MTGTAAAETITRQIARTYEKIFRYFWDTVEEGAVERLRKWSNITSTRTPIVDQSATCPRRRDSTVVPEVERRRTQPILENTNWLPNNRRTRTYKGKPNRMREKRIPTTAQRKQTANSNIVL
jgi:hypothetical protein